MSVPVFAVVVVLDQATKWLASDGLSTGRRLVLIPNFLQLRYAENTGAAFSMFEGHPQPLAVFTLFAIVAIVWIARSVPRDQRWLRRGYSLIVGGAAGNLIDRVFRGEGWLDGHVVDFIDAHWFHRAHWPTFNIADSAICVGVALAALAFFIYPEQEEETGETDGSEGTTAEDGENGEAIRNPGKSR